MSRFIRHLALLLLCCLLIGPVQGQSGAELDKLRGQLNSLQQPGRFSEALPVVEKLLEAVRATFGENSGEYAATLAQRGAVLQALSSTRTAKNP